MGGDINKDGLPELFVGEDGELTQNGTIGTGTVFIYSYVKPNGIEDHKELDLPEDYNLFQNYPNPFNPSTVISYQLLVYSFVTLKIYDVQGREIKTLVNEIQNAGVHKMVFNGQLNSNGDKLSSGIYFY
jgi:hypothetical protein